MVNYVLNVYFKNNYSTFQNQILNNNMLMLMMAGNPTIVTVWNYNPILLLNKHILIIIVHNLCSTFHYLSDGPNCSNTQHIHPYQNHL